MGYIGRSPRVGYVFTKYSFKDTGRILSQTKIPLHMYNFSHLQQDFKSPETPFFTVSVWGYPKCIPLTFTNTSWKSNWIRSKSKSVNKEGMIKEKDN